MWTEAQLAYLAGIIDGEGTVNIYRGGARPRVDYNVRLYVVSTDRPLIDWLQATFGGLVYKRDPKIGSNWKTKYEWVMDRALFDGLSTEVLPYLVIKKPQMELALEFRSSFGPAHRSANGGFARISQEVRDFREDCFRRMKALNHRGQLNC